MRRFGICANVDLRTLELYSSGHRLLYLDSSIVRASIADRPEFWGGADRFLVYLDPNWVIPDGYWTGTHDNLVHDWFARRLDELDQLAGREPEKAFVIANTIMISEPLDSDALIRAAGHVDLAHRINQMISDAASGHPNIIPMNWSHAVTLRGASNIFDPKYWYLGRMPLSAGGSRLLWEEFQESLNMVDGAPRKVLCVDLDNTLWRGICGEEGPRGIGLSEEGSDKAFRDLQSCMRALKELGVLLTVNSKNNASDALAVFRDNPMMILREEDFAAMRINWESKASNIASMARELSLGTDSFVFIDDSNVEREIVRQSMPEVVVPEFPRECHDLPAWFRNSVARRYFRFREITAEDRARSEQYRRRRERSIETATLDPAEAIRQLDIKISVERDVIANLPRLRQMSQKTNQFNLTTIRYAEAELEQRMRSAEYSVWNAWYRDKFGDEGIVAMAVVSATGHALESFLMSCRVIGRHVEYAFLGAICRELRNSGFTRIDAAYLASEKNAPCRDFLSHAGFHGEAPTYSGNIEDVIAQCDQRAAGVSLVIAARQALAP